MGDALAWDDIDQLTGGMRGVFDLPCPLCSGSRKPANRRLKVLRIWREDEEFARFSCAHCGAHGWAAADGAQRPQHRGALWGALYGGRRLTDEEGRRQIVEHREEIERVAFAEFCFFSASPIAGTPAEAYLERRRVPPGADMRFAQHMPFGRNSERSAPALIVAARNLAGELRAVQATYLEPDGRAIRGDSGRTLRLTHGALQGAAAQLEPLTGDTLAIAEGTEKARAFTALFSIPTWAAFGSANLVKFQVPPTVRELYVAGDNDQAGFDAATALAERACSQCRVIVSLPPNVKDWDDMLAARPGQRAA